MYFIFFMIWIIFNGRWTWEIALIGVFVAALLYAFICRFMEWSLKKDVCMIQYVLFFVKYLVVLLWEILKANFETARIIFTSKYQREPILITFRSQLKSPWAKVLLANSITLTPGTITVSVEGDLFTVHALDKDFTEGIERSVFVRMLEKAERIGGIDE